MTNSFHSSQISIKMYIKTLHVALIYLYDNIFDQTLKQLFVFIQVIMRTYFACLVICLAMCRAQQISPRGQTNLHSSYLPFLYRQYLGDAQEMDEWNKWPSNTWSRGSNRQGWSRPSSTFFNRNPHMYLSGDDDRWWNPFSSRPAYTTGDTTTYYNMNNDQNGRLHRMSHAYRLYGNYQRFHSPWFSDDFTDHFSDMIPYYSNQFNGWEEGVRRSRARGLGKLCSGILIQQIWVTKQ